MIHYPPGAIVQYMAYSPKNRLWVSELSVESLKKKCCKRIQQEFKDDKIYNSFVVSKEYLKIPDSHDKELIHFDIKCKFDPSRTRIKVDIES